MKFRLKLLLLAIALIVPCLAVAQEQDEPTIYVIKQGDTLWGLSERFIKDPNYWPNMWSKNSQITNPHVIYPGQKVRVFPDRLELLPMEESAVANKAPQTVAAAVAETGPLAEIAKERTYAIRGSEGFILESGLKPVGKIVGINNNHNSAGGDEIVYTNIGSERGVKGGEKFSVYRKEGNVSHPITNEILGTRITPLGTIQLTDLEKTASRAIITKNYLEITPGSYLMPAREKKPREVTLKMPARELRGYIVDSYGGIVTVSEGDIVYIDLGSDHGAEPGNMLYIVRDVTIDGTSTSGFTERLPQELLGALVILETGKQTATALIVKSIDAIYRGDKLISYPN